MTALDVVPAAVLGLAALDVKESDAAPDDLRLWSVTTIIGALNKPALMYWSAEQAAIAAVREKRTWEAMLADRGEDEAIKWLRDARFRRPKGQRSASELGEAVHAACEAYALTGTRPDVDDEVAPFLDQFDRWLQKFTPSYQATEVAVFNGTYEYAGTVDAFLTIDGVRFISDYKTSRKNIDAKGKPTGPYPEVALQLSAYRFAEMAAVWRPRRYEKWFRRTYLLSPEEQHLAVPVPEVDAGLCIHITPQHCEAYPVRVDVTTFDAFLFCQECYRWQQELSKDVLGEPLRVAT